MPLQIIVFLRFIFFVCTFEVKWNGVCNTTNDHLSRRKQLGQGLKQSDTFIINKLFFNLGYAKAKGYGRISIAIAKTDVNDYLKAFELEMRLHSSNWHASNAFKELFAMSSIVGREIESTLAYMQVTQFQQIKNSGYYLRPYSIIANIEQSIPTHSNQSEIDELKNFKNTENSRIQKENEEKDRIQKENELRLIEEKDQEVFNDIARQNDKSSLETFINQNPTSSYLNEANKLLTQLRETARNARIAEATNDTPTFDVNKFSTVSDWAKAKLKVKGYQFTDAQIEAIRQGIINSFEFEINELRNSPFHDKNIIKPICE